MAVTWTEDQRRVIDTRKKEYSRIRGAGSGKTAVLSQRILSLIMDPEDPADIDALLVVTFTRRLPMRCGSVSGRRWRTHIDSIRVTAICCGS